MPQPPTCTNIKIRSVRDAQTILYACHQGHLPMIKTRLDSGDRHALASGNVYAWEERGSRSEPAGVGIERFTEGKRWTPSRLREDFLYYYEKYLHLSESDQRLLPPPINWDPFIKQTYSAWVTTAKGERKWHLTAYYTDATCDSLKTIDDISLLRDIVVPEGHFRSNADVKSRRSDDRTPVDTPSVPRTYAPFRTSWSPKFQRTSPLSQPEPQNCGRFITIPLPAPMVPPETRNFHHSDIADVTHTDAFHAGPVYAHIAPYQRTHLPDTKPLPRLNTHPVCKAPSGPDHFDGPSSTCVVDTFANPHWSGVNESRKNASFSPPSFNALGQSTSVTSKLDEKITDTVCLVPLQTVLRAQPYRRDPLDDKALRMLDSRT